MPSALTPGTLYIVATPIGNLEDITYRAVRVLGAVDLVAAEDTRRAATLCAHYGITTRRVSLHAHNEAARMPALVDRLAGGQTVALISDAGTPLVSDPGARLARAVLEAGRRVEAVPGPSAVLAALVGSGLASDAGFSFVGFAPARSKDRIRFFSELPVGRGPVVFFEAPHRIKRSLLDLKGVVGNRQVAVCRELTKIHEFSVVGPINRILAEVTVEKGEFTVVIDGGDLAVESVSFPENERLVTEFYHLTSTGLSRRAAVRALATRYRRSSREVYQQLEAAKPIFSVN